MPTLETYESEADQIDEFWEQEKKKLIKQTYDELPHEN